MLRPTVPRSTARLVAACLLAAGGCAGGSGGGSTELLVFAAGSLTDAFGAVAEGFEQSHPAIDVRISFAGSSTLREQLLEGAPADVFAAADEQTMSTVESAGLLEAPPVIFARNQMEIAVPAGNPGEVAGLDDFTRSELLIGLCAAQVPCGNYARQVLDAAGVVPALDSDEPDVRSLLTKIEAGELDAGIVYRTDVLAGVVEGIALPAEWNVAAAYPIAVLADAPEPEAAGAFLAFVTSSEGARILAEYGFLTP